VRFSKLLTTCRLHGMDCPLYFFPAIKRCSEFGEEQNGA
jgi:hypothetical protein